MEETPKRLKVDDEKKTEDQDLEAIAEAIIDACKEESAKGEDSFDNYSKKLRNHFYEDIETFKKRFENGYYVLLDEVQSKSL